MIGLLIAIIMVAIVEIGLIVYLWRTDKSTTKIEPAPEPEREHFDALTPPQARPIIKDDPPRWVVYRPPVGKQPPFCCCHGDPIRRGAKVLWWPVPHSDGRVDLFCEDGVELVDQE